MPVLDPHPVYFLQAVRSVLEQTLADFELIIVEDPSPTAAAGFLKDFADSRIRHVANPKRTSLVEQLNQGIGLARSDWIARMDADDIALPDRLEKQMAFLVEHPKVSVFGSQLAIMDDNGRPLGYRAYPRDHAAILRAMRRFCSMAHPSVVMRKDVILAAGGYRHVRRAEDYDLWCRVAEAGGVFANHAEALVRYRLHGGSAKSTGLREQLRNTLAVKQTYFSGKMSLGDQARYWGERALLWFPPRLVHWLFLRYQFRARLPQDAGQTPVSV
jgi:glycosyltransferase involved in cell wall biosynthesis